MSNDDFEKMAHVQAHRVASAQKIVDKVHLGLANLGNDLDRAQAAQDSMERLLAEADNLLDGLEPDVLKGREDVALDAEGLLEPVESSSDLRIEFDTLEILTETEDLDELVRIHMDYARRHGVDVEARLSTLLSHEALEALRRRLDEEFTAQSPKCDKWDYMLAAVAGVLGGVVDVVFVGAPGEGLIGRWSEAQAENTVRRFAKLCGWSPRDGSDEIKSAIGFLERKFRVNYDQRYGADVDFEFPLRTLNHHIKSLAHSPDVIGLFFSILGQFTDRAFFVDEGRTISIEADGTLEGHTVPAKLFSGFVNWLGHIMSDAAGSSGAKERGAGLPIPFFSLLQFLNVGAFGPHRQTFAKICVQVYEQGYDLRHGMAMAVPVIFTELVIRVCRMVRLFAIDRESFELRKALAMTPELQRMLFVGHGAFCLVDVADAACKSGCSDPVSFLVRCNLIGWVRFGFLAYKELRDGLGVGHINREKLDTHIEDEYMRILTDLKKIEQNHSLWI